jgi:spore maturation protein CgeB
MLAGAGIEYGGYLPNWEVPRVFSEHRVTVHIPRRPYVRRLPGIPTIRPFEAMASGIPMISAPWNDAEGLFDPGSDFWIANDGPEMVRSIRRLLERPTLALEMVGRARATILRRHTCAHRVKQLLEFHRTVIAQRSATYPALSVTQTTNPDPNPLSLNELGG